MTISITESLNTASKGIDEKTVEEILLIINEEDGKIPNIIKGEIPRIGLAVELVVETLRMGGNIFLIGSGTSGRLGVSEAAEIPPTFSLSPHRFQGIIAGGSEALTRSVEVAEDSSEAGSRELLGRGVDKKDLVIGISASGRTPFVLGGLKTAYNKGVKTIGITCNHETPLSAEVDIEIVIDVGPEVVAGSTRMKAGTAQKMVLNMITTTALIKLGRVYDGFMVGLRPTNKKLMDRAVRILVQISGVSPELAGDLLTQCNGDTRLALLMALTETTLPHAKEILRNNQWNLRDAVREASRDEG